MDVQVTPLPGIGTRKDFSTRTGRRVGVISYRDGHTELIASRDDDPDSCALSMSLSTEEANALASLLGAPNVVSQLSEQQRELEGLKTSQYPIQPDSPYAGRTLGDTELRSETGVSVVAVMRRGTLHPSPMPDFGLESGDLVVMVGTVEGLREAAKRLERG